MTYDLLRAVARTMLASYFVSSGIKAIRDPELVPAADLVDRVVPLLKEYTPAGRQRVENTATGAPQGAAQLAAE